MQQVARPFSFFFFFIFLQVVPQRPARHAVRAVSQKRGAYTVALLRATYFYLGAARSLASLQRFLRLCALTVLRAASRSRVPLSGRELRGRSRQPPVSSPSKPFTHGSAKRSKYCRTFVKPGSSSSTLFPSRGRPREPADRDPTLRSTLIRDLSSSLCPIRIAVGKCIQQTRRRG